MDVQKDDQNYERLRAWYLAMLRSKAIDDLLGVHGESMTPASLILADSQLIHKLVEEPADAQAPVIAPQPGGNAGVLVISVFVVLVVCALALPLLLS